VKAHVDVQPYDAFVQVAVPLNKTRHQDFVRITIVRDIIAPRRHIAFITHRKNSPFAHGYVSRRWLDNVHCENTTCTKNCSGGLRRRLLAHATSFVIPKARCPSRGALISSPCATTKWHATLCPGNTSRSAGGSCIQTGWAAGHLPANRQPDGGLI